MRAPERTSCVSAAEPLKKKRDLVGHIVAYVIVNAFLTRPWFSRQRILLPEVEQMRRS